MQPKKKILTVDDDPINNQIIQEMLGDLYDVETAVTGHEALRIARDFQPDIILLDITMPGIGGYEVCRLLRAIPDLRDTTVIMVSANKGVDCKAKAYEVGARDYITKPFTEESLHESVSFFLREEFITCY